MQHMDAAGRLCCRQRVAPPRGLGCTLWPVQRHHLAAHPPAPSRTSACAAATHIGSSHRASYTSVAPAWPASRQHQPQQLRMPRPAAAHQEMAPQESPLTVSSPVQRGSSRSRRRGAAAASRGQHSTSTARGITHTATTTSAACSRPAAQAAAFANDRSSSTTSSRISGIPLADDSSNNGLPPLPLPQPEQQQQVVEGGVRPRSALPPPQPRQPRRSRQQQQRQGGGGRGVYRVALRWYHRADMQQLHRGLLQRAAQGRVDVEALAYMVTRAADPGAAQLTLQAVEAVRAAQVARGYLTYFDTSFAFKFIQMVGRCGALEVLLEAMTRGGVYGLLFSRKRLFELMRQLAAEGRVSDVQAIFDALPAAGHPPDRNSVYILARALFNTGRRQEAAEFLEAWGEAGLELKPTGVRLVTGSAGGPGGPGQVQ